VERQGRHGAAGCRAPGRHLVIALDPSESTVLCRGFRDFVGPYVAHCHKPQPRGPRDDVLLDDYPVAAPGRHGAPQPGGCGAPRYLECAG
jgi:hypothetical protein